MKKKTCCCKKRRESVIKPPGFLMTYVLIGFMLSISIGAALIIINYY